MRAFFSDGVDKMHVPWVVEGLPTLLHLSLFLFFGGLAIFLFNVNREVFTGVVWWIGLFSTVYVLITLLPLIRQDSPYYTPLSIPAWFLYMTIPRVLLLSCCGICFGIPPIEAYRHLKEFRYWSLEKKVVRTASKWSPEIDIRILDWTICALGDDDSLEKFFEAISGLFKSKLVKHLERDFPESKRSGAHWMGSWAALCPPTLSRNQSNLIGSTTAGIS
jgi:hypothetical protein